MKHKVEFHEIASIFPLMNERDYQELKTDIAENGLCEPIVLHSGRIIDGRHRYRVCLELDIEPKFREWDGQGSLLSFLLSMNLHRRHLTTSQRALLAAEIKSLLEQEARARQGTRTDLGATLRASERGKTSNHAARMVNVSARSVESANRVQQRGIKELTEAVKRGDVSISLASMIADLPPEDQEKIISIKNKRELRQAAKDMQQARSNGITSANPDLSEKSGDVVPPILGLLERATEILGNRDPVAVALMFFQEFPFHEEQMIENLERCTAGSQLMCEIHRLWRQEQRKAV